MRSRLLPTQRAREQRTRAISECSFSTLKQAESWAGKGNSLDSALPRSWARRPHRRDGEAVLDQIRGKKADPPPSGAE